jgi:hypothetical protein
VFIALVCGTQIYNFKLEIVKCSMQILMNPFLK